MKKMFPSLLRGVLFGIGFIVVIGGFVLLVNATRDETKTSGDGTNSNTKLTASDRNGLVSKTIELSQMIQMNDNGGYMTINKKSASNYTSEPIEPILLVGGSLRLQDRIPDSDYAAASKYYVDKSVKDVSVSPQYTYIGLNTTNKLGASLSHTVYNVDFCIINHVQYSTKGGYCTNCSEYCYAYPVSKTARMFPNGKEVENTWNTLGRTDRKLYAGGDDDDQIDCGFICVRF